MADYEDYEVVIFPDFNEFTLAPSMSISIVASVCPLAFEVNGFYPCWKWIPETMSTLAPSMSIVASVCPLAFELNGFYPCWKWIPETQLCEQERNEFSLNGQSLLERYNEIKGTNFEFVRLVKIQLIPSSGIKYFIQFEAKPSSTEYTLKTFEGSMFKSYVHSNSSLWPMSCKLLGPNSQ